MRLSRILLLSIFISVVILVVIAGVTSNVFASKPVSPTVSPEVLQAYQQREAEYSQLLQQANQQIEKANADLQSLHDQIAQQKSTPASHASPAVSISVEQAGQIANQAAEIGQTALKDPELVDFEGKTAYEVAFPKGSIYVDAETGAVLYNGTVPQKITADKAAQVAGDYLNNHEILKVDQVTIRGVQLFRVIFKNGTLAWLDQPSSISAVDTLSGGEMRIVLFPQPSVSRPRSKDRSTMRSRRVGSGSVEWESLTNSTPIIKPIPRT